MSRVPDRVPPGPIKLTYEDYVDLPDDGRRYEILDGELEVSPAPAFGSTTSWRATRTGSSSSTRARPACARRSSRSSRSISIASGPERERPGREVSSPAGPVSRRRGPVSFAGPASPRPQDEKH